MSTSVSHRLSFFGVWLLVIGCNNDPDGELISRLQNRDVDVRRAAARALGQQPTADGRVVVALATSVADQDAEVRRLSINALGEMGPAAKSSLPALTTALQDPEPPLRVRAALAIQKLDPQNSSFQPVLVGAMRAGDGRILLEVGAMGKDAGWAIPTLIALLSHESAKMRALAAQTLGRIGPAATDAIPTLQRATRDPNVAVQAAAHDGLDRVKSPTTGSGIAPVRNSPKIAPPGE